MIVIMILLPMDETDSLIASFALCRTISVVIPLPLLDSDDDVRGKCRYTILSSLFISFEPRVTSRVCNWFDDGYHFDGHKRISHTRGNNLLLGLQPR